ncbi:transcription termination factor Rho [Coprobacillus sp. AM26-5AC]|jgi:sugar phosphate isomerase/epimerase|uniref:Rho termination factor N-terminal domain-containing protein n=1 Tax=Faecalibacillus intestinalis TaxID=1982626 RepID=A0AAW4VHY4_9FIRM|nr:Rho termination factor N-terminal domain-containing protein [Faecalibacillus intestinalis]MCB8562099.1 Rho termination factor N-terminal domain-containing protein [Faecalibacillus intestinalis]MCG4809326.1 Rho termination factor N-terminal domain-containing protein [Faecalibacillus intestinalis]RGH99875.1 transcription termination factor Rho [Coprobacillus sp. AM26-5AC]
MKIIINGNVERTIEDEKLAKYKALGYKEISSSKANDNAPENKPLSKMKVDELKALATELGIENTDSLTRDELIAVIKEKKNG